MKVKPMLHRVRLCALAITLLLGGSLATSPASKVYAADAPDMPQVIKNCLEIKDESARLRCYDLAAGYKSPSGFVGSWLTEYKRSALDNTEIISATNEAKVGVAPDGRYPFMAATCDAGKANVYVQWFEQFNDDDPDVYATKKYVLYKIGQGEVQQELWPMSGDQMTTFAPDPIKFLQAIGENSQLVIQVTANNKTTRTLSFDVSGTKELADRIAGACE